MGCRLVASSACFLLLFISISAATAPAPPPPLKVFNVQTFGAVADGKTDNAKAFLAAWSAACACKERCRVLIPRGRFLVDPLNFTGPCNGSVQVKLKGTVLAPADLGVFPVTRIVWIAFNYIDGLLVTGGGTFDGQGASAWACARNTNCRRRPKSVCFNFVNNSHIQRISSVNSKQFHFLLISCQNITMKDLKITAPGKSPNTDGVHLAACSNVKISRSIIGTGDDCISIGHGNRNVSISGISCGPGHGISVGSLGLYPDDKDVLDVRVRNCSFKDTDNGVRIKTWPASYALSASNFKFENIVMKNVTNPIIIDQEYCDRSTCNRQSPSRVKISHVKFKNITGTTASKIAINLLCSELVPCEDVELNDIDLVYNMKGQKAISSCSHVKGKSIGHVIPPSCI
uniref:Exopolygalacturonase n=1 Tax=Anthurium amnicola TaxID=1678845 RepID=A0A1D1ZAN4_9ARAE